MKFFSLLLFAAFVSIGSAGAPLKAYANCFSDGMGHLRMVGAARACGPGYYCMERESAAPKCFNPDGTRKDWIRDASTPGGWRERTKKDRQIADDAFKHGIVPCNKVGDSFGRSGFCRPGTGTALPQTAADRDAFFNEFRAPTR